MNLIETIALRRSGHHAIMSWYIKNLLGSANWDYTITVQAGTKSVIWNDGGYNENEISHRIKLAQSTVNQHSRSVGWNAIDKAVTRYSEIMINQ